MVLRGKLDMSGTNCAAIHQKACQKWPDLNWSAEAFCAHSRDGLAKYPYDHYLAGAAGQRLQEAWRLIEVELGDQGRRLIRLYVPKADFVPEELWADSVVKLMGDDKQASALPDGRRPAVIIRYRGHVQLLHYFVFVVAKRLAIGRNRKNKPGLASDLAGSHPDDKDPILDQADSDQPTPDESVSDRDQFKEALDRLSQAMHKLSKEQKLLIQMVYVQGMQQKHAGAMLQWSPFKANREMKKAMTVLRQQMGDDFDL